MAIEMRALVRSIIAVGLLSQPLIAGAAVISDTQSFTSQPTDVTFTVTSQTPAQGPPVHTNVNTGPTSDPDALSFALFNSALGTLNSVTITFTTSAFNATATLVSATNGNEQTHGAGLPDSVDFFADGTLTLKLSSLKFADQLLSPNPTVSASCLGVLGPGDFGSPGTCSNHSNTITAPLFSNTTGISGLTAGSFVGAGFFDITATLSNALAPRVNPDNATGFFADNATFSGRLSSLWSGSVTVQYDYTASVTAVPEPVTLYLLLAGLGGLALTRRRRR